MTKRTLLARLSIGAALVLSAEVAAAQITFTGFIEPATLASFCQEETHFLTCTGPSPGFPSGVLLKSSAVDLDKFVGKNTKFTAIERGVECTIYDVIDAVTPPPATLVVCGNPVPGCPMRFRVGPSGVIGQYWLFFSTGPAFLPQTMFEGTILIASPATLLASGQTFGPTAAVDVTVPPNVSLTGMSFWFQGARQDIGPVGPIQLTNAVCLTVLGPSPPCFLPDC